MDCVSIPYRKDNSTAYEDKKQQYYVSIPYRKDNSSGIVTEVERNLKFQSLIGKIIASEMDSCGKKP